MRRPLGLILVALLAGAAACSPEAPPAPGVEATALELFELAAQRSPDDGRVDALFGDVGDEKARAELVDAIVSLEAEEIPVVVNSYPLDERLGFDLEARVGLEGVARFSVVIDPAVPPGRIVWFTGPGVEWPQRRRRGPGVSTSSPPETHGGG